jgi:hypothetical protein
MTPEAATTTIDQYATEMSPLNLNDVWNVTSTGPTSPQKMWTSSHTLMDPRECSGRNRFRAA